MTIIKATKKPTAVRAIQLLETHQHIEMAYEFVGRDLSDYAEPQRFALTLRARQRGGIEIHTPEGTMFASFGDYIIEGVNGEFYPCKEDIFLRTYTLPSEPPTTFEREDRYIVLKRKHLDVLNAAERDILAIITNKIARSFPHKFNSETPYLVIESDWPEYEPVWRMIEKRVTEDK